MSRAARSPDSMAPSMPRAVRARCSPQSRIGPCGRPISDANRLISPGRNQAQPPRANGSRPHALRPVNSSSPFAAGRTARRWRRGPARPASASGRASSRRAFRPITHAVKLVTSVGVLAVARRRDHARRSVREHARPVAVPLPEARSARKVDLGHGLGLEAADRLRLPARERRVDRDTAEHPEGKRADHVRRGVDGPVRAVDPPPRVFRRRAR